MQDTSKQIAILSFYSFVKLLEPESLLPKILLVGKKKYIRGTILLAKEGFNGSISGDVDNLKLLVDEIIKLTGAIDVNVKINYSEVHPFQKLKVKIKQEIVSMRAGDIDINNLRGHYVETKDWDEFISQSNVVVIDTRNDYEVEVGCFKNSIEPKTETFRKFPEWVEKNIDKLRNKKIAMYCTGGIRCEKSTSYLRKLGFDEVYHLRGGILQYLEDTKNSGSLWQGECFVFDDRRMVADDLSPSSKINYEN